MRRRKDSRDGSRPANNYISKYRNALLLLFIPMNVVIVFIILLNFAIILVNRIRVNGWGHLKGGKKEQGEAFIGSNLQNLQPLLYMTAESLRLSLHRRETGRPSTVTRRKGGSGAEVELFALACLTKKLKSSTSMFHNNGFSWREASSVE